MTDFSLENVIHQALSAGMSAQLCEAVIYNYEQSKLRYDERHFKDNGSKYHDQAGDAWGYIAARQTIKTYIQKVKA